ncbi:MAG TPA: methylated-DNA--[protein]-cysteine S-methyltransferase [Acidimicrobiales bacterium]|jgi:methylated-DNA-[protein]-cysteine S-methyltransferase
MTVNDDLDLDLAGLPAPDLDVPDVDALTARFADRALAEGLVDVAWATIDSPIGPMTAAATERGLVRITFGDAATSVPGLLALSPRVVEAPARLDPVRRQLDEYFEGRRTSFDVPLDRALSSGFRLKVLRELERVRYGEVTTYRDLATRVGNPRASRAVGTAMATNPIPIVVPCHRVVRTGGHLGGYGGGLPAKEWLLRLEGVLV